MICLSPARKSVGDRTWISTQKSELITICIRFGLSALLMPVRALALPGAPRVTLSESFAAALKRSEVVAAIEELLTGRWLHELMIPSKERVNNSKRSYLVALTIEEHDALLKDGELPVSKLVIPKGWCKPPGPPVPIPEVEKVEDVEVESVGE